MVSFLKPLIGNLSPYWTQPNISFCYFLNFEALSVWVLWSTALFGSYPVFVASVPPWLYHHGLFSCKSYVSVFCIKFVACLFSLHAANTIPAVTEFVAQLQILELLDNVRTDKLFCYLMEFIKYVVFYWFSYLNTAHVGLCRQFLRLVTRLSCTSILLLKSVKFLNCSSKLIPRQRNLWKRKYYL